MPKKLTTDEFIKKANIKYHNKYDYSLVDYKNDRTKIKIICPRHGIFEQTPKSHLHSGGCKKCGNESKRKKLDVKGFDFLEILKNKATAKCIKCNNVFTRSIYFFKKGTKRCPFCKKGYSLGEEKIFNFLNNKKIKYQPYKTFDGLKYKKKLNYDFYLPDFNLLVECQGEQHYKPKNFGGISYDLAKKNFEEQLIHDKIKKDYAIKNGIELLEINYKNFKIADKLLEKYLTKFKK